MRVALTRLALFLILVSTPLAFAEAPQSWYPDVPVEHTNRDAIFYVTQKDFASGFDDGNFKPDELVNRAQATKFMLNVGEIEITEVLMEDYFEDLNYDAWYMPYIENAVARGIVNGNDGLMRPSDPVNTAEALKMLMSASNTEVEESDGEWFKPYMNYAYENGIVSIGTDPSALLTRGQLSEIIFRFKKGGFTGEVEHCVASYYGWSFDGANTASGRKLEAYGYQTAHLTHPFGTMLKVTNPDNKASVIVEVVDRGPHVAGRCVDLTPAAFEELAPLSAGLAHVYVEVLRD